MVMQQIENYLEDIEYCVENDIKKLVIFVKGEKTLLAIKQYLDSNKLEISLIGVTFPANEVNYRENNDGEVEEFIPESSKGEEVFNLLKENDITLIRSALPFEGIVIPGEDYNPYQIVSNTLDLVKPGLANIVQMTMIATDHGSINPKEDVVATNGILFVSLKGVNSRMLFHPEYGLEINSMHSKK